MSTRKVPVTIVTGFLGAGKTTLVRHAVENAQGRRLALIVNEFGDVGVDGTILRSCGVENCPEENIIELTNGCLCCTVADDFIPTLEALLAREPAPEHIIIETSGLALPKPLVKAFEWPDIRNRVTVDGVVTVVDAPAVRAGRFADDPVKVAAQREADPSVDHENPLEEVYEDQLLCADLVVLNKCDHLSPEDATLIAQDIRRMVPRAIKIVATQNGVVPTDVLLGISAAAEDDLAARPSHHDAEPEHDHDDFETFIVEVPELSSPDDLAQRAKAIANDHDVLRVKGFAAIGGKPMRLLLQGVGERIDTRYERAWQSGEARVGRLVVIGQKGLDRDGITPDPDGRCLMHIVVRESRELDEAAAPQDLGLAPADIVFLSFSDSDLAMAAAAFRGTESTQPSVRIANLNALRHPMSVDLFADATLKGSKAVIVRLLGGLDYWRYGGEQLGRRCRELGITLAIVPGDGRPDIRLSALSTLGPDELARLEALLDVGGIENTRMALLATLGKRDARGEIASPREIPNFGVYRESAQTDDALGATAVVFYRSHLLAGDVAPVDALVDALEDRGLAVAALYVPSLKAADAAAWLQDELQRLRPSVIVNATAFASRDGADASPLDVADCPVLQVALANSTFTLWEKSQRGLSAADLAMHVVLPELDGRLFAGVVSFKEADTLGTELGVSLLRHVPYKPSVSHVAELAARWAKLRSASRHDLRIGLLLSTYPGRPDQIAHAVGLDGLESACRIASHLEDAGYDVAYRPSDSRDLVARLDPAQAIGWQLDAYRSAFDALPEAFKESVVSAWGPPEDDDALVGNTFRFRVAPCGSLLIGLQPERGQALDRKAQYHDPATPPRHSYVAFYLWLRHVAKIDALIHLGAHGTLEWLPGKAVAGSETCAPRALLGPTPMIYPFIVNDPGEAAQAKRRLSAVTLGHKPPPMTDAGLSGPLSEVERLVDEFASAEGLDPRRRKVLSDQIVDAAIRAGIAAQCGLDAGMAASEALTRIDAFLCDVKELSIRDGLHILDKGELEAITRALAGKFIAPGPAGAPSRGRSDVLPTGRNLFSVDPRSVPTATAWASGKRAAKAILDRYLSDHGEWPRAIVLDLWGSATLRTGGEELATALALLGVRPVWDQRSYRVTGVETEALAELGRPRVDVTLRISGLFRDMFGAQLALFDSAVALVVSLEEDVGDNPLRQASSSEAKLDRIFGPAGGSFGAGVMQHIDRGDWSERDDLGRSYLASTLSAYRGDGSEATSAGFERRVKSADAFVHVQDHSEIDLLTGGDFAAHEGGFAAAAASLGNDRVALYHGDTAMPDAPRVRTLQEECARVIHGRAANIRWIEGQMRHGFRGGAEMAQSVDAAFAFAATARAVDNGGFERLYEAYLGDPVVAAFLARENPDAIAAMRRRFEEAIARGLWQPRRNDIGELANKDGSSREAAE